MVKFNELGDWVIYDTTNWVFHNDALAIAVLYNFST